MIDSWLAGPGKFMKAIVLAELEVQSCAAGEVASAGVVFTTVVSALSRKHRQISVQGSLCVT